MRSRHGSSGVTMSFVDMFACALGALIFILFTMSEAENDYDDPFYIQTLRLVTDHLPVVHAGQNLELTLSATGGAGRYVWALGAEPRDRSKCDAEQPLFGLPPGLKLLSDGRLVGEPKIGAEGARNRTAGPRRYCFDIEVIAPDVDLLQGPSGAAGADDGNQRQFAVLMSSRKTFALDVWPPLVRQASSVHPKRLPDAFVGQEYEYRFNEGENVEGRRWSMTRSFKSNGKADSTTVATAIIDPRFGILRWTPSIEGMLTVTVTVDDTMGVSSAAFEIRAVTKPIAYQAPIISTNTVQDAVMDRDYETMVAVKGGEPPFVWKLTGTLPPGFRFAESTGIISGRAPRDAYPDKDEETYDLKVSATDARGGITDRKDLPLRVVSAGRPDKDLIRIVTKPEDVAGRPFVIGVKEQTFPFTAMGGWGEQKWDIQFLGDSLGLRAAGNRILSSVAPAEMRPGAVTARVSVSAQNQDHDEKDFIIDVVPAKVRITSSLTGDFAPASVLEIVAAAQGGVPPYEYRWRVPPEIQWLKSREGNGVLNLSGDPPGPSFFNVVVGARDSQGNVSPDTRIPVLIPAPLAIRAAEKYVQNIASPFQEKLFVTGAVGELRWEITQVDGGNWLAINGSGELVGIPQNVGKTSVIVSVIDEIGQSAQKNITILIIPKNQGWESFNLATPLRTWNEIEAYFQGYAHCEGQKKVCELPPGVIGRAYILGDMRGGATVKGSLPKGLNKFPPHDVDSYWTIGGTPQESGDFTFRVVLFDGEGNIKSEPIVFQLVVLTRFEFLGEAFRNWFSALL